MNKSIEAESAEEAAHTGAHAECVVKGEPSASDIRQDRRSNWPDAIATAYHVNTLGVVHLPFSPLPTDRLARQPDVLGKSLQPRRKS